jgi:hypothetical protein
MQTSHTFATEAEVKAFMLGFQYAGQGSTEYAAAHVDHEEPRTVHVYGNDDDDEEYWLEALAEYKGEPQ